MPGFDKARIDEAWENLCQFKQHIENLRRERQDNNLSIQDEMTVTLIKGETAKTEKEDE